MESVKVPFILLVLLVGVFLYMGSPFKPPQTTRATATPTPTVKPPNMNDQLKKASEAFDKNDFQTIIQALDSFKTSDDHRVQSLLGYGYAGLKDLPAAAEAFEKALKGRRDPSYAYSLAYVYETMGEFAKARDQYQDLKSAPLTKGVMLKVILGIARCSALINEPKAAFEAYKEALKEDPTRLDSYLGILKLMKSAGSYQMIPKLREKGDQYHSENFMYNFLLGNLYYDSGDFEKALTAFQKAAKIDPKNSSPFYYIYRIYRKTRKIEEAVNELEKFYVLNPYLPFIFYQAALDSKNENRLDLAFKFLRTSVIMERALLGRDDNGTIYAVERYVQENGTSDEKLFMQVFKEYTGGNFRKALELAIKSAPKLKDRRLQMDNDRLIVEVRSLVAGEDKYNSYLAGMREQQDAAMAALKAKMAEKGNQPEAVKADPGDELKRVALSNPKDAKLQYSTALQLARLGDLDGAKTFLRETIRANPTISEAYYSLGKIAKVQGDLNEASNHLLQAVKVNPANSQAHSMLATIFLDMNDTERARQCAESAINNNPNNSEARLVLAKIFSQTNKQRALDEIEIGLAVEQDPQKQQEFASLKSQLSR